VTSVVALSLTLNSYNLGASGSGKSLWVKNHLLKPRPHTTIHAGRLNTARDRKTMADMLCIPTAQVVALQPLDWIERDIASGITTTGRVKIPARR
jgi:hypothetical protein